VCIGEGHALRRELVEMRRGDLSMLRIQAPNISIAEGICKDVNDVGFLSTLLRQGHGGHKARRTEGEEDEADPRRIIRWERRRRVVPSDKGF
jgi:hypothetical protein